MTDEDPINTASVGTLTKPQDGAEVYAGPDEPNSFAVGTKREALKRFMKIMSPPARDECDCAPWPGKCPYCGKEGFDVSDIRS